MKFKLLLLFVVNVSFVKSQKSNSTNLYINGFYNKTLYDYTVINNSTGVGLGALLEVNAKSKIKIVAEISFAIFGGNKILISNPDGTFPLHGNSVENVNNIFIGGKYYFSKRYGATVTAGVSIINQIIFFGVKPCFYFFIDKKNKWLLQFSFTNIFNRTRVNGVDFGYFNLGIGRRLF